MTWAAEYQRRFRGNVGYVGYVGDVGKVGSVGRVGQARWRVREAAVVGYAAEARAVEAEPADPEVTALDPADPDPATLDPAGSEADRLLELADEIVVLSAHIQAATHRLLVLVAEFDRLGGWRAEGHRTCAHFHGKRCQARTSPMTFERGTTSNVRLDNRSLFQASLGSFGHISSSRSRWPHKRERVLRQA